MDRAEIQEYINTQSPQADHPNLWYQEGLELPYGLTLNSACVGSDCSEIWGKLHLGAFNIFNRTVLDIGCNTGYYAMRAMEEGAKSACGIDVNTDWMKHGKQFAEWKEIEIEWCNCDFYDFNWGRKFDLVFALQIIYHLGHGREPLKLIAKSCNETLALFTKIRSEKYTGEIPGGSYVPTLLEIEKDLKELGFEVTAVDYLHDGVLENVIQSKAAIVGKVAIKAERTECS